MAQPLEVLADLKLSVDGEGIDIQANGDLIVVDLSSLQAGRRLLASGPFSGASRAQTTRRIHEALLGTGLTAELRLDGEPFGRIGVRAEPGRFGRLFGLRGVELNPTPPVRVAIRRRPVLAAGVAIGLVLLIGTLLVRLTRS